jgi:hypothetical protein
MVESKNVAEQSQQPVTQQKTGKNNNKVPIIVFSVVIIIIAIISISSFISNSHPKQTTVVTEPNNTNMWFQGGNLHKATFTQWRSADNANKLATCADWLSASLWKGHLNTPNDFNRLKPKAKILLNAIDEAVKGDDFREKNITDAVAVIIQTSNNFAP